MSCRWSASTMHSTSCIGASRSAPSSLTRARNSKLRIDQRLGALGHLLPERSLLPLRIADAARALEIVVENRDLPFGELAAVNVEVSLVVEPERAIVEVGRPDRQPDAVDHQDLAVEHRRLEFIDL